MPDYIKMYNDENFKFDYSSIPYSPDVPPHFHNCYEILFFEKGDAVYMVEGNIYNLSEGDILITNPREMHCPVFRSNKEYQRSIFFFKPAFLSDFISEKYNPFIGLENRKIGSQNRIDTKLVRQYKLDEKFKAIREISGSDAPEKELVIKTNLLQFLITINNLIMSEKSSAGVEKINEIILYINQNITSKLTLDTLAGRFYMSKYYISHLFTEKTGITLKEYITKKRILLAKENLLEKKPLGQVARDVGFSDYSSFYRAFKKTLGYPPSAINAVNS
jgi:YesN/AraC family two-component response regulator